MRAIPRASRGVGRGCIDNCGLLGQVKGTQRLLEEKKSDNDKVKCSTAPLIEKVIEDDRETSKQVNKHTTKERERARARERDHKYTVKHLQITLVANKNDWNIVVALRAQQFITKRFCVFKRFARSHVVHLRESMVNSDTLV